MLYEFIRRERQAILDRARAKIGSRAAPLATYTEITNGIPLFVDQLCESLRMANETAEPSLIVASAMRHGNDLHRMGFTITQVVHDYGDICQAVTELAEECQSPISIQEFRILNKCLDDAIAGAVTEYSRAREATQTNGNATRLGELAHELRNKLSAATLAHMAIKAGAVGIGGSTGTVLERNLRGMRGIIDGALAAVRIESGVQRRERIGVFSLVEEIEADATLEATERGVAFAVLPVAHDIEVSGDRAVLAAAVINLLHNAFKFSRLGGYISLAVTGADDRVLFAVQDECGGLPRGKTDDLFQPFAQRDGDRSGLGLGLSISRRGIEAHGGKIHVRDLPGAGCVFTIDLPRLAVAV